MDMMQPLFWTLFYCKCNGDLRWKLTTATQAENRCPFKQLVWESLLFLHGALPISRLTTSIKLFSDVFNNCSSISSEGFTTVCEYYHHWMTTVLWRKIRIEWYCITSFCYILCRVSPELYQTDTPSILCDRFKSWWTATLNL